MSEDKTNGELLPRQMVDAIRGTYVSGHIVSLNLPRSSAEEIVAVLLDGPLSDRSVLVQIPLVRELVEACSRACMIAGPGYLTDAQWRAASEWEAALAALPQDTESESPSWGDEDPTPGLVEFLRRPSLTDGPQDTESEEQNR